MNKSKCNHLYLPYYDEYGHWGFDSETNRCLLCEKMAQISETYKAYNQRKFKTYWRIKELLK